MALADVTLEDKYTLEAGRVFLTGTQAVVRLPLMQRQRDLAAGLNTACFVSGYRGSPLGNVDREMWRAAKHLKAHHVHFQPGVNEDLAATAIWGSQQLHMFGGAKYDGVFALWYGKGPGVDRSGDALRHANYAGTAPNGGVLALAGDDPACKSSTVPSQSEYAFMDAQIPILNPGRRAGFARPRTPRMGAIALLGVLGRRQDHHRDHGFVGLRLRRSRARPHRPPRRLRDARRRPPRPLARPAARAGAPPAAGIGSTPPSPSPAPTASTRWSSACPSRASASSPRASRTLTSCRRFEDLGIDDEAAAAIGLAVYKVAMSWPLERDGIRAFAEGLDEILVVEEKRAVIENQTQGTALQLARRRAPAGPRKIR